MKTWIVAALVVAMAAPLIPTDADAKRLGGSRSSGMQRDMPARTAPDAPPAKPAAPQPAQPTQAGQAAAPAAGTAAGATARRSWMGPIAGLAAGLGIAALASALGFGEALANFLTIALLVMAVLLLVGFVMRRMAANKAGPAMATSGANRSAGGAQVAWPGQQRTAEPTLGEPAANRFEPVMSPAGGSTAAATPAAATVASPVAERSVPRAFVPAAFDAPAFERAAKMIFIRLQAANDTGDLNDLRSFTTPEMFAELKLDLQDRGTTGQHTDVVKVEAQVLDVAQEADAQVVSVRFTGQIREEAGGPVEDFDEVWHMVKPLDDSRGWAIAGIEQMSQRH